MATQITELQREALRAWFGTTEDSNVLPFRAVASRTDVPPELVRRVVRALARKGLLEFCQMSWNEDGPCGAGYMPTKAGRAMIDQMHAAEWMAKYKRSEARLAQQSAA